MIRSFFISEALLHLSIGNGQLAMIVPLEWRRDAAVRGCIDRLNERYGISFLVPGQRHGETVWRVQAQSPHAVSTHGKDGCLHNELMMIVLVSSFRGIRLSGTSKDPSHLAKTLKLIKRRPVLHHQIETHRVGRKVQPAPVMPDAGLLQRFCRSPTHRWHPPF